MVRTSGYIAKFRPGFHPQVEGQELGFGMKLVSGKVAQQLQGDSSLEYLVPNDSFQRTPEKARSAQQESELPSIQWGLHNTGQDGGKADADIDAPEAWAKAGRGEGALVAVLDTGTDVSHPDLVANRWTNPGEIPGDGIDNDGNGVIDDVHGLSATDMTGDPFHDDPHGTHTTGTIAANGKVVGVAPEATFLPIRIFDDEDWTDAATIVRALYYAQRAGAHVTCNSYSGLFFNQAVHDAFANTSMLHVVAAGNHHSNNDEKPHYPPNYELDNLISVAASDRNDGFAGFSNFGKESVDLAAPGVDIYSTTTYGNYGTWSGTSMAAPHVAGVGALVAATFPEETPTQWKQRILESVDPIAEMQDKVVTGGRLNAAAAVSNPSKY